MMNLKIQLGLLGIALGCSLSIDISPAKALSLTLYNGTGSVSGKGLYGAAITTNGSFVPVSETPQGSGNGVLVDTDANNAEYSGYSNFNGAIGSSFPTLDRDLGYSIFFNVALDSTTNYSNDRSAFSITAISSDRRGIELGFESNLIFAQNPNFNRAENAAFTTSNSTNYELRVLGDNYQLFANNSSILTGGLKNYIFNPQASNPPLLFNPYTTSNFIFFGDNTGQESGEFTFKSASVNVNKVPFDLQPNFGFLFLGTIWGVNLLCKQFK